jgi:ribose transport system permease protein
MSTDVTTEPPVQTPRGSFVDRQIAARLWGRTRHFRPVLVLVVLLFIFFAITQSDFSTGINLKDMLTDVSVLWVVSMGMTFVVIVGGIDLSVAAVGALVSIFIAKLLPLGVPPLLVMMLALLFGTIVGMVVNGGLIGIAKLSFFVVTLASLEALTGIVSLWSGTNTFFVSSSLLTNIGTGNLAGVPTAIWIMAATFFLSLYVQTRTYFGRDVYAVGGSIVAARLSGVRTSRTVVTVYAISGFCAALGGVISTGRIGAAVPTPDTTLPLQAGAAVLLGGTSLLGGSGGVGGTFFGVLFIGVLANGLSIAGVASFWQEIVTGIILVAAVLGDRMAFVSRWPRLRGAPSATGSMAAGGSGMDAADPPA